MRDEAREAQVRAAAPESSTWLAANAGSGKTRVLIDRVVRLLLAGTPPQRILCLTYTNAAATEMQNRLFQRLGAWAMRPDAALTAELAQLSVAVRGPQDLAQARRLFARAIETPGGLRIQTIHAFCAGLLRRFPLEAGVSPRFIEIDEITRRQVIATILEALATGPDAAQIAALGALFAESSLLKAAEDLATSGPIVPQNEAGLRRILNLPPDLTAAGLAAEVLAGFDATWWRNLCRELGQSTERNTHLAARLSAIDPSVASPATLDDLDAALMAKTGDSKGLLSPAAPTKAFRAAHPALFQPLQALADRLVASRPWRLALAALHDSLILSNFAAAFLPRYAQEKSRRGWLDFDDLIARAERLLSQRDVAAWVLYRLDGGIDHILVDEAQDTSPAQWRVIDLLTQEFTAGLGAREGTRTLFVVGDKKQSIYSFQGADVSGFDSRSQRFGAAFRAAGHSFVLRELVHSFRSSPAILRLVDRVFWAGQPAMGETVHHIAFHDALPGQVDIWPCMTAEPTGPQELDPIAPVDQVSPRAAPILLAERLAQHIRSLLAASTPVPDGKGGFRPLRAGDILILLRRRSGLLPPLLRACKLAGLPVAGADRIALAEELAVKDLLALLQVLALPEDDLTLAALLRSPLCGWSEAQLFDLAQGRSGFLWQALRGQASPALAMLTDLRDQADFLRPHDLLERALTRHRGRARLLARLGDEAEEAIDALMALALTYESVEVPSLDGFLTWMQGEDSTIKRQLGEAQDRIRIMTVHGAKGLESEFVILPDTADRPPQDRSSFLLHPSGAPLARQGAEARAPAVEDLVLAKKDRDEQEALRLLYVALTRARSRLLIAAAGKAGPLSWHGRVWAAMQAEGAIAAAEGGLALRFGDWPARAAGPADQGEPAPAEPAPDWLGRAVAPARPNPAPLSPSDLGGAKALPGSGDETAVALARGTSLHALLQHLPGQDRARWPQLARALVPLADQRDTLLAQAARLIDDPALAVLFGADSLAEVAVAGLVLGRQALGAIDRLLVGPDRVLAVDFKTNRQVPATPAQCPEGILRQMGAYAEILAQAFPGRAIDTAILWTETACLMPLEDEMVRAALQRATTDGAPPLDVAPPAT